MSSIIEYAQDSIIECVPNISEGRNTGNIETIVNTIRDTTNITFAGYSSDVDHNRTVITMFGNPKSIGDAVIKMTQKTLELVDLNKHSGEHPRMGAVDVIPFIPIRNISMEETVTFSKKVAMQIWLKCGLPVFLYENSATAPNRKNLANIRRGQFEFMSDKIKTDEWKPDYGESRIHPTAGVVAVGARDPLVAFNINLSVSDVSIAKKIAKTIRYSDGGFIGVKAIGIFLKSRNIAQVSINMTDLKETPLYRILEAVRGEAEKFGVSVTGTEIIGLTPKQALTDCAEYYLQLESFNSKKQVIEEFLYK